jgi:hypothetical protein
MPQTQEIARTHGWQGRLVEYLVRARRTPFKEGQHDCALFAAGAVAAMTGTDIAQGWRGRYRTTAGGMRVLRREGFSDHVALVAHHFAEVPVVQARPGDIAVVNSPDGAALGVVQGEFIYVLRPTGFGLVGLMDASLAFKVN